MSKTRDTNIPQHHADQGHYGEFPLSLLPSAIGFPSGSAFLWDGSNWYFGTVALSGGGDSFFEQAVVDPNAFRIKDPYSFFTDTDETMYYFLGADYQELGNLTGPYMFLGLDNFASAITGSADRIELQANYGEESGSNTAKHVLVGGHGLVVPIYGMDPAPPNSENAQVYYNSGTHEFRGYKNGAWEDLGAGGSGADEKVKVSSNDTTAKYLAEKVVAGTGITIIENNDGGDETLTFNAVGSGLSDELVKVSANDTTAEYLVQQLSGTHGITIYEYNNGGNEYVVVSGSNFDVEYLGTFNPYDANSITTAFTANQAIFTKFVPGKTTIVSTVWYRVNTTGGNLDMGIYDDGLNLLSSTGSFAAPSANANLSRALTSSVSLVAGHVYYIAFAASSTSFRMPVLVAGNINLPASAGIRLLGVQASALPLPSTASPTWDGASATPRPSLIFT